MPRFQWELDGPDEAASWEADPRDGAELVYRMLRALPVRADSVGEAITLRMYSNLEGRWVDFWTFGTTGPRWPYLDIATIFENREPWFRDVQHHGRGWRSRNPCGEVVLDEPQIDALSMAAAKRDQWRELIENRWPFGSDVNPGAKSVVSICKNFVEIGKAVVTGDRTCTP